MILMEQSLSSSWEEGLGLSNGGRQIHSYIIFSQVYEVIPVLPAFFPSFHSVPDYTVLLHVRKFLPLRLSPAEATSWCPSLSCLQPTPTSLAAFGHTSKRLILSKTISWLLLFPRYIFLLLRGFSSFFPPERSPLYPLVLPSKPFSILCPPPQPRVNDYFSAPPLNWSPLKAGSVSHLP